MSTRLVTFADGSLRWRIAANRLERQAKSSGWFTTIHKWNSEDINREIPEFRINNPALDLEESRGFGYWLWRPYILQREMESLALGETMLFLDAGCQINQSPAARERFQDYLDMTIHHGNLIMEIDARLSRWCKRDLSARFFDPVESTNIRLVEPGVLFLRRNASNRDILDQWIMWSEMDGYHYLDDTPSVLNNAPDFVEHRHDQSILTCLSQTGTLQVIPQETYFPDAWRERGRDFPIWTLRNSLPFNLYGQSHFSRASTWMYRHLRGMGYRLTKREIFGKKHYE